MPSSNNVLYLLCFIECLRFVLPHPLFTRNLYALYPEGQFTWTWAPDRIILYWPTALTQVHCSCVLGLAWFHASIAAPFLNHRPIAYCLFFCFVMEAPQEQAVCCLFIGLMHPEQRLMHINVQQIFAECLMITDSGLRKIFSPLTFFLFFPLLIPHVLIITVLFLLPSWFPS